MLDAGGTNSDSSNQQFGERHWTLKNAAGYNWGYKTVPQENLAEREIDCSRGKGLGGSTAINFCVWTRGSKDDYERWAELTGCDDWKWENVLERFKKIERFHRPRKEYAPFVDVGTSAHGFDGPIDVGYPDGWEAEFGSYLSDVYQHHPRNPDPNSGNLSGVGVCQVAAFNRLRVTASAAFLSHVPSNLTVMTGSAVERVLFEGQRVVGVKVAGETYFANREVILSAGAIDSPKLLLLSGIGPADELKDHGIKPVYDLPGVGKNLHDRLFFRLVTTRRPGGYHRTSYIDTPAALVEARKEWATHQSGSLSSYHLPQMIGYFKAGRVIQSKEFQDLGESTRRMLEMERTPDFEILSHNPNAGPAVQSPEQYFAIAVALMNTQSSGTVTLASTNPSTAPLIDPKFLSPPFDCRLAIESLRAALAFLDLECLKKDEVRLAAGPAERGDKELLDYVRHNAISMWHPCSTCKMGPLSEPSTCVDSDFRLLGVQGLRVVDMSVAPSLPSAHTQAVAYLIGETAAEKIIAEYLSTANQ